MKMLTASSNWARTCAAPWTSTSRSRSTPCSRARSYSDRAVPYHSPWTSAHSRNSPASLIFWKAGRSTKWYSIPSFSPGRGLRVVCEIENCRRSISASARARTVDFPAPDGPETTIRFGSRSLNVLHLLADALDLLLERDHLVHHLRRRRLAADGVDLAGHLLGQEVEPLAARRVPRDRRPRLRHVAAEPLHLLRDVVALDQARDFLVQPRVLQAQARAQAPHFFRQGLAARRLAGVGEGIDPPGGAVDPAERIRKLAAQQGAFGLAHGRDAVQGALERGQDLGPALRAHLGRRLQHLERPGKSR